MTLLSIPIVVADTELVFQLVTVAEHARAIAAPGTGDIELVPKSVIDAPSIVVRAPPDLDTIVFSPLDIEIGFEAANGVSMNMPSLRVYYDSFLRLDVTERILEHAQIGDDFVRAIGAELPSGRHEFIVEIDDALGRSGSREFEVRVGR